ncbi:MAG: TIGR04219 family outer membrane beta-barrel protein [Campylobacterales bacterium]
MKKIIASSLLSLVAATSLTAEGIVPLMDLGINLGYNIPQASGYINYQGTGYRTNTVLSSDPDKQLIGGIYLEHPIPLVPNIAINYLPIRLNTASTITVTGGGHSFTGGLGTSKITLDSIDLSLYYNAKIPFSDLIKLRAGLTGKILTPEITTTEIASGNIEAKKTSAIIPMGHLGATVNIPFIGIGAHADYKYIGLNGHRLSDATFKADYKIPMIPGLKAEAGYRVMKLKLDDLGGFTSDATLKGFFAGVAFVF